ncbi:YdhR family protein [Photobacterium damselae]
MHTKRLQQMGVSEVRGQIFDINEPLSLITHAPMGE